MYQFFKYALLISITTFPLGIEAQSTISRKAKPTPSQHKSEHKNRKPKTSPLSSNVVSLQAELKKLENDMIYVEGGTFLLGANADDPEADSDEKPVHSVTLSSFYICKYEVTQSLWKAVMGTNPSCWKGDSLPVETVDWNDCTLFISKLNALTGKTYRLPTEAEWEFSARGGNVSRSYKYSGSNNLDLVAWYSNNSGEETHPVGTKECNELGLYDMNGNVREWCSNWFGNYNSKPQTNPQGPQDGYKRIHRGGSWWSYARNCRIPRRCYCTPDYKENGLGLRLALSISKETEK